MLKWLKPPDSALICIFILSHFRGAHIIPLTAVSENMPVKVTARCWCSSPSAGGNTLMNNCVEKKSSVSATLLFPTQNTGTTPLAPEAPDPPNEVLVFRRTEPSKSWLSAHLLYSRMQPYYSIYDWRANFPKHFWRPRWRMQMQSQWNGSYMLLFLKFAFMQPLC